MSFLLSLFGTPAHAGSLVLVFLRRSHLYQKFISACPDISKQDQRMNLIEPQDHCYHSEIRLYLTADSCSAEYELFNYQQSRKREGMTPK